MVTYEELKNYVRRFRVSDTLHALGRVAAGQDGPVTDEQLQKFPPWGLAFLARTAILHGNDHRHTDLDGKSVARMIELYQNLEEPFVTQGDSADSFFIRTAYEQFLFQEGERNLIPRALALFEILPKEISARSSDFDIPAAIQHVYGMSLRDLMLHASFISAATRKRGAVHADYLTKEAIEKLRPALDTDKMTKVLSIVSCSFGEFRDLARRFPTRDGYEKFSYNPLFAKPAIWSEAWPDTLVVPAPTLLVRRMTVSIFYDVLDALSETEKKRFMTRFGEIVEAYVGRLLEPYIPGLIRETDYAAEGGPDFAVRVDSRGALLETKSARLTVSTKSFADERSLQTDLSKGFLEGLQAA